METHLFHIAYGLVAKMGKYPENFRVWRTQDEKSLISFQAQIIKAQSNLQERQQTSRQGGYGANQMGGTIAVLA